MKLLSIWMGAVVMVFVGCTSGGGAPTGTGPSTIASPGPASPRIVFVLGAPPILYTAASDGSDAHALTDFGVEDPDWSPDGSMISFDSEYAGRSHIFTIN